MRSFYNDYLRALGLPEEPQCEQCGLQIRRNMESPYNLVLDRPDGIEVHRFCGVACLNDWSAQQRAE